MQIKFNSYGYFYTFKNAQARSTGGGGGTSDNVPHFKKDAMCMLSAEFGFVNDPIWMLYTHELSWPIRYS